MLRNRNEQNTLKSVLTSAILTLRQQGIPDAARDAWLLLEFVCGIDHSTYYAHPERELTGPELQKYWELVEKRGSHIPVQQLTGVAWFYGLPFSVNESVLIPRQDTETLVEEVLHTLPEGARILDLCTGSGCILTAILTERKDCTGVGADLSPEALQVAEKNAFGMGQLKNRAEFLESDLFQKITGLFDVIVSNPPYIPTDVIGSLMTEVRDHEPRMALDGSRDGLEFYRRITKEAPSYLKPGGRLCLEIGYDQGEAVCGLLDTHGFREIRIVKDLAGKDRVVTGKIPMIRNRNEK